MRVLLVSDFYAPYVGGVEQHVRSLAHALTGLGHEVQVATTATERAPAGRWDDGPVVVHRMPTASGRVPGLHAESDRPWAPPIPDPIASLHLRRLIRGWDPDVVHGHDWLARSAAPWCGRRGPALVTTLHYYTRSCARKDLWTADAPCSGPSLQRCVACANSTYGRGRGIPVVLGTRVGALMEARRSTVDIAVSHATAAGNGASGQCTVIPNPLPPAAAADGADALDAVALPGGPFLLFVGDQRAQKGFEVLLGAYRLLLRSNAATPDLVVVGERDRTSPTDLPPGVWWTGPLPHGAVQELYNMAMLTVVPSVWAEPFGMVAIEAMAAGCPVVVSDTGGLGELVDDGVTGVRVPPGDPLSLAAALDHAIADPDRRAAMAAAATGSVGRFAPGAVVAQVEAAYHAALDRDRRAA